MSQVHFLKNLLQINRTDYFYWNEIEKKRITKIEWNAQLKYEDTNQLWFCPDLIELLLALATTASDQYVTIYEIFQPAITNYSDVLLAALVLLPPGRYTGGGQNLLDELYSQLFPIFLQNQSNLSIIEFVWKNNPDLLYTVLSELYKKENKIENTTLNLSRVLDITQHLNNLQAMVKGRDYQFSVALGILAGKREFLHFDAWFQERIKDSGEPFIEQVLIYLKDHVIEQCNTRSREYSQGKMGQQVAWSSVQNQYESILEKAQLNVELLAIILESLAANRGKLNSSQEVLFEQIFKSIGEYFPTLMKGSSSEQNEQTERAANQLLENIFREQISIEESVKILRRYKLSEKKEEKEIFACIITGLLEEQSHHSKYPDKELRITAQLIGSILEAKLLDGKAFQIMLNIVSEYIKKRSGDKFLKFALVAIKCMESRLTELDYRKICDDISSNYQNIAEEDPNFLGDLYTKLDALGSEIKLPEDTLSLVTRKQIEHKQKQRANNLNNSASILSSKISSNTPDIIESSSAQYLQQPQLMQQQQLQQQQQQQQPQQRVIQGSVSSNVVIGQISQNSSQGVNFQRNISEPGPTQSNSPYARLSVQEIVKLEEESYRVELADELVRKVTFELNSLDENNLSKIYTRADLDYYKKILIES